MYQRIALLTVAAIGCAQPIAVEREPIVGGTTDNGDPGVVLIIIGDPTAAQTGLCSGSVVSPHVVMTAGHCVSTAEVGAGPWYVYLGNNLDNARTSDFIKAKETHAHPAYNNRRVTNDIGVVIMNDPLPPAPLPMNKQALTPDFIGMDVRMVGFGTTGGNDPTGMSAGTKRQVTTTLDDYNTQQVIFNSPTKNTCEGDSGGPAFLPINGVETIVGVTSIGYDQNCDNGGADTRVDVYASSFVQPYIDANDAPPVPDMAGYSGPPQPGQPGGACGNGVTCQGAGAVCTSPPGSYCAIPCDPAQPNACPSSLRCEPVDKTTFLCARTHASGGCSAVPHAAPVSGAALLLLAAVALLLRRQKLR